jgi:PPOX class probable F420-dependent enzyme
MVDVPFDAARESYVSLATFRRDGREVRTAVWIAPGDGRLYVYTNVSSGKVKRIRANGRVRLAACDARGRVRGEWSPELRGRVVDPVRERELFERGFERIIAKYGWQMRLALLASRISGRYADRAIITIEG